ncbi:hypothetical protein ACU4GD_16030 [Cupriavidus basilensis]
MSPAARKTADQARLTDLSTQLDAVQDIFYAEHQRKLLVVLQGMDTSGKDGTVRGVFRSFDPLGIRVVAFKAPTAEELAHDYLWRIHAQVPRAGEIVVFNRSHYEDVPITRVHEWIDQDECERRYKQLQRIRDRCCWKPAPPSSSASCIFPRTSRNPGLQARLADPQKHWKLDLRTLEERAVLEELCDRL